MPFITRDATVLLVLVFCVPLQYWLSQITPKAPDERTQTIHKWINEIQMLYSKWLTRSLWEDWLMVLGRQVFTQDYSHWYNLDYNDLEGECPAVEVWHYRSPAGNFATSPKQRRSRPIEVKMRIGQVVKQHPQGYSGVIIGWDLRCQAPEDWKEQVHGERKDWCNQPNYALLADTHDLNGPQITYEPQENLTPIKSKEIKHPELIHYFRSHDGAQYIPQPWLKAIYPRD